jgi:hypothetical protein
MTALVERLMAMLKISGDKMPFGVPVSASRCSPNSVSSK